MNSMKMYSHSKRNTYCDKKYEKEKKKKKKYTSEDRARKSISLRERFTRIIVAQSLYYNSHNVIARPGCNNIEKKDERID